MDVNRIRFWLLVFLLAATMAGGCAGRRREAPVPAPAESPVAAMIARAADPGQKGALAILTAYAEARRSLDFDRGYALLTPSAQDSFTPLDLKAAYNGQKVYSFKGLEVEPPSGGVTRGWVLELEVTGTKVHRYARFPYTLRYEGGRWGVAQAAGLRVKVIQAFDSGQWEEDLRLVDHWLAVDPYAWEAHLERYYVFKDMGRPAEAKAAWEQALALAPPEELPDMYDILCMLYSLNRQGEELMETARLALESAERLGKPHAERYDLAWRAGVLIDMAFANRYRGDEPGAMRYFQEARALSPKNIDVERFWRTMPAR